MEVPVGVDALIRLLFPSDAADDLPCFDFGGPRILIKKNDSNHIVTFCSYLSKTHDLLSA